MSEYEYYTNSPYTNYCKMKGHEDREERQAATLRIAAYRIHQSLVQKPLTIQEFMSLPSDKTHKRDVPVMTREMWKKIKATHKLK